MWYETAGSILAALDASAKPAGLVRLPHRWPSARGNIGACAGRPKVIDYRQPLQLAIDLDETNVVTSQEAPQKGAETPLAAHLP